MSVPRECLPLTSLSQVLEWIPQTSATQTNEKIRNNSSSVKQDTGSGEQLKDIQTGSEEQLKDTQPGSEEQLKDTQPGSVEELKDTGSEEHCNDLQSQSDSHHSVERSSFCLPGSCWTSCGTWDDLVSAELQDTRETPKTLVCHDMQGGYLQDRWADGTDEDGYYFSHWTHVDIFVYFSHHLVTIPPEGWIAAARRHGTSILGTIITEWDDGKVVMEELLEDEDKRNKFVSVCAEIARTKGFHGWLINIENPISEWLVPSLLMFVSSLTLAVKAAVPGGMVIWYDSVTMDGKLNWQNELNENNKPFFDLCDGIFLNYTWKVGSDDAVKDSENVGNSDEADKINNLSRSIDCLADAGRRRDIFVGVDVFGRGCLGGGGFNCRQPLQVIRQYGLSTAIFAPGWTYEGRQPSEEFWSREITFWRLLQPYLSFRGPHLKSPRVWVGRRQPHTVFQTCFSSGRGGSTEPAPPRPWFNLKKMEFQPSFPAVNDGENKTACYVSGQHWYRPSQSLLVAGARHTTVPVLLCRLEVEPATPTIFLLVLHGMHVPDVEVRLGIVGGMQVVPERVTGEDLEDVKGKIDVPEDKEGWEKLAFLLDKGLVVDKIGLYLGSNEELYLGHFSIHCLGTQEF